MKPCVTSRCIVQASVGVSAIELLVVLIVLALLVSIALPQFVESLTRSRRTDAMVSLQRAAGAQQKYYFDNRTYAADLSDLGLPSQSPDGHYVVSVVAADQESFVLRAVPKSGGAQAQDGDFQLTSRGEKLWDRESDGEYECSWADAGRNAGC